jgi:hypothetical protein
MKIQVKNGVVLKEVNDVLLKILDGIDRVFLVHGTIPTITSLNDGTHMKGSLHYKNAAVDLRVIDIPQVEWAGIRSNLAKILGPMFQVILEKDHIHIETSPAGEEFYNVNGI